MHILNSKIFEEKNWVKCCSNSGHFCRWNPKKKFQLEDIVRLKTYARKKHEKLPNCRRFKNKLNLIF